MFDSEEETLTAIEQGEIKHGDVVVIRYEGPKGGPGMREMLTITSAIMGAGLGKSVALITDGVSPAARTVSSWATLRRKRRRAVRLPWCATATASPSTPKRTGSTWTCRTRNWRRGSVVDACAFTKGVLYKYMKMVSSASQGCVTDE